MTLEVGIPAALLIFAFFFRAAQLAWRQSRQNPDPDVRLMANALLVVFAGVAVNSLMDPMQETTVNILLWMYAGIAFNLGRLKEEPEPLVLKPVRACSR